MEVESDFQEKLKVDGKEEEIEPTPQVLEFNFDLKEQIQTHSLIIGLYGLGSLFIQAKISQISQKIGAINFEKTKQRALADIYKLKDGEVVILFNDTLDKNLDYHFSDALFAKIQPQRIGILDNVDESILENYDPEAGDRAKGLRVLSNSMSKMSNSMEIGEQLEVGNHIKGIGADLLIESEYKSLPCDLYLAVTQDVEFTIYDFKLLEPLSTKYVPFREKWNETEVKKNIKKFNQQYLSNNLYM